MTVESTVVLLFCAASATAVAVRRLRVPYTVALVIVGLTLGSFNLVTPPPLTRELLFTFFLPGLLFEAAFHLDLDAFRRIWRSAVALAVPGVILGMLGTAAIAGVLLPLVSGNPALDWKFGLLFGLGIGSEPTRGDDDTAAPSSAGEQSQVGDPIRSNAAAVID